MLSRLLSQVPLILYQQPKAGLFLLRHRAKKHEHRCFTLSGAVHAFKERNTESKKKNCP